MNFDAKYSEYQKLIEERLSVAVSETDAPYGEVVDSMRYSLLGGGKRIRAILIIAFCEMFGGDREAALDLAVAVEMVHCYSLIHDDLPSIDNDDYRRGKLSNHKKFCESTALLAGDALLTEAFVQISHSDNLSDRQKVEAIKVLSYNIGYHGMIGGQVVDIASENKDVGAKTLETIHKLKTGKLIESSGVLGAIAADASAQMIDVAVAYCNKVGLVFQIVDDILDVTADFSKLGKPINSDDKNKKATYVSLYSLDGAKEKAENLTNEAKKVINNLENNEFLSALADKLLMRSF